MAKLILENLTPDQVETLSSWLSTSGEQEAALNFELLDLPEPTIDFDHPNSFSKDSEGSITIHWKTP